MTIEELQQLGEELVERWPNAFGTNDLPPWFREMNDYPLADVICALDTHRNRKAYSPKTGEIIDILKESGVKMVHVERKRRGSALAESVAKENPHLADRTDAELVAGHYRALYTRRLAAIDEWASCGGQRRASDADAKRGQLSNMIRRESGIELMRVGLPLEQSNDIAAALIAGDDEFRAVLATLNEALFA